MEQNRNYIVAIALSVLVLIAWQFLYLNPQIERERAAQEALQQQQTEQQTPLAQDSSIPAPNQQAGDLPQAATGTGGATLPGAGEGGTATQAEVRRIAIETPALTGSINLLGGRFDDLKLNNYRETVDPTSPIIELLSPASMQEGYFAEFGFRRQRGISGTVPGPHHGLVAPRATPTLTPSSPVVLNWTNDKGLTFQRTISVDEQFHVRGRRRRHQQHRKRPYQISPYGRITRLYKPQTDRHISFCMKGLLGVFGDDGLQEIDYDDVEDDRHHFAREGHQSAGWALPTNTGRRH